MNQVYTIVLTLALVGFVLTAQTAHGEDVIRLQNGTMVPNTLGVGAPNSEGITLLPDGTYGAYVNGAVGNFGDTSLLFEHQFYRGNSTGTQDRHDFTIGENQFTMYSPLPAHTNDNYTNYYIGFDNGAYAADKENQHSTVYYHDNCGTDHTNEYCVGFKAGWNYETNALGPPPSASSSNVTPTASKV
jgi:hypothetical protein